MQSRISTLWLLIGLVAMSVLSTPTIAEQPYEIRIGIANTGAGSPPRVVNSALAITQAHGLLEKEFEADGIKIRWIFFKGAGPAVNEAFSNQQIDIAFQGDLPAVVGRSGGLDTRILLMMGKNNFYLAVRPDSGITRIEELRGKRIALHKGTNVQLGANRILGKADLRERDVRIFNLDILASLAAFQSGDLDAIFSGINLFRLQDLGTGKVIYGTAEDPPFAGGVHLIVRQPFAKKYPQITQRVVNAVVRSAHYASLPENREEVLKSWENGSITTAHYEIDLQGSTLRERLSPLLDPYSRALYQAAIDDAVEFRLIRRPFSLDEWLDERYLNQALRDLKLEDFWQPLDAEGRAQAAADSSPATDTRTTLAH